MNIESDETVANSLKCKTGLKPITLLIFILDIPILPETASYIQEHDNEKINE